MVTIKNVKLVDVSDSSNPKPVVATVDLVIEDNGKLIVKELEKTEENKPTEESKEKK
jgi:hypothetical protein